MTTKDEALALALEALEEHDGNYAKSNTSVARANAAITAIKQAQEPVERAYRTDEQIVEQTEALAKFLLSWGFNHQPETTTPMRESSHPFAERCWAAACHIQEMLTDTDPENAVANMDEEPATEPAPKQAEPVDCKTCNGTGAMDSGGAYPWGEQISVPCYCQAPATKHAVPEGYKLAPVEPDELWMYRVIRHHQPDLEVGSKAWLDCAREVLHWHPAMLAAAPTPPEAKA